MKTVKYFIQFFFIFLLFFIFKILGLKKSSSLSKTIVKLIGPFFRSKQVIKSNILKAMPKLSPEDIKKITKNMWGNYGRILSEYVFIKDIRNSEFDSIIQIKGIEILNEIKLNKEPVIFVSGHFSNFELMAMCIDKSGIELAAIYRPLNNKFLNYFMEILRKKYICKNQLKKGISGTKEVLRFFKKGTSIALMIDQRVSEGIKSSLFNHEALTTTIPAQFVKKYQCKVVPIYIERLKDVNFKITVSDPIEFNRLETIESITIKLNELLEKMIMKNPDQWIWTHNRWK
jgi:Kdo2-lipid IVA lauroyltransferase/acyltransferase